MGAPHGNGPPGALWDGGRRQLFDVSCYSRYRCSDLSGTARTTSVCVRFNLQLWTRVLVGFSTFYHGAHRADRPHLFF